MKQQTIATWSLVLIALIWGNAFILVQKALDSGWQTFPLLTVRGLLGGMIMLFCSLKSEAWRNKKALFWGILTGALYFGGYAFQTAGQPLTTVPNSAFLTALYVILVPLIMKLFFHRQIPKKIYIATAIAVLGTALLTLNGEIRLHLGDALILIAALMFALQIIYGEECSKQDDVAALTSMQLLTMGLLSFACMPIAGQVSVPHSGWVYVIAVTLLSSTLAQFLQIYAQRYVNPSTAGLILSQESTVATVASVIFLGQKLSVQMIGGCVLMLLAILMVEVDFSNQRTNNAEEEL